MHIKDITMTAEKAPFTFYREGYTDGYFGHLVRCPKNTNYMNGYREGKEADQAGEPCRYLIEDTSSPVKPSQCA